MAWKMNADIEQRRELGVQQLLGIARFLDGTGAFGPSRMAQAVGMTAAVEYGRKNGVHYDGGDWRAFVAQMSG